MMVVTRVRVAAVLIALSATSAAWAQPFVDPRQADPRAAGGDPRSAGADPREASGERPRLPITLPSSGEIFGGDAAQANTLDRDRLGQGLAPVSLEHPIDPQTYVCGTGDAFELEFWGSQNFQLRLVADLEGRAFIPRVGFLPVAGKTLAQVRTAVKARLHALYPGLSFDLTLISPRSFVVHVAENVRQPGAYVSRATDRVSTVIARASMAPVADRTTASDVPPPPPASTGGSRRRIAIKHRDGTTATADLVRYELTGDVTYNPFLLDGDVITVPFASPMVSISGAVRRPGPYELIGSKDLAELLDLAGGFTPGASRALPIRLLRRNAQQQQTATDLPFAGETPPNSPLRDDDQVIVRGSDDLQRTVQVIGAVAGADSLDPATTSRRIQFVDGDTVLSLLDRAGGIKAPGDLRRSYISRPRLNQPPALVPLDLEALLVRRDFTADRPIQMNDTIVIPPMQYSVMVEGAVVRAGLYNYNPTFGISEYIAHAGGRTRTAEDLDSVQLIDTHGHTHPYQPDVKPAPGDAVLVPERNFSRAEIAQLILAGASILVSGIAVTIAATR